MKKTLLTIFFVLLNLFAIAQETITINDFSIENKKKKTIILYKNETIKELPNANLEIFNTYKNFLVLYKRGWNVESNEFYLLDKSGNFLFEKPFKSIDFSTGLKNPFAILEFPDYSILVDTDLKEIPNTRFTKFIRSPYNDEADLSIVWQKYGKKSQLYLFEIEKKQNDGSIKKGLIDLSTATVIANPIFYKVRYYGFLENGVYVACLENNKAEALYDFNGKRISEFYDFIYNDNGYFRSEKNKLFGLISKEGKELVKPSFKNIQHFKDGNHFVCTGQNDKIGIIDSNGKILMPFEFSYINYKILENPMANYIPVTIGKLYGYYGIKEKKLVTNYEYDLAGPEVSNVANVRHTNGETQIISFNDYSTGALLKNSDYKNQTKVLANYIKEKQSYFSDKYKNAVTKYKTKEEALKYFYPYYREFCTEIIPNINVRIDAFKKEFGNLFSYEEEKILENLVNSQKQLKKKMDENIEKAGGQIIHLQGY